MASKTIQRAYPRLIGGVPQPNIQTPYVGVMEMQKVINQLCDWIFELGGGGGGGVGGTSTGNAVEAFSSSDLNLALAPQPVPGTLINLSAGIWTITGLFFFEFDSTMSYQYGTIGLDGAVNPRVAIAGATGAAGAQRFTAQRTWLYPLPGGGSAQLYAGHQNATAGAVLIGGQTGILAVKIG